MKLKVDMMHFEDLNHRVRTCGDRKVTLTNCLGQRYIAAGLREKQLELYGTPGNALGAYLDGARVEVFGNAQDATGDTMNGGRILIHGSSGDATGYAMRGGEIFVRDSAGYRAGIHMKAYRDKVPVLAVGGRAGSFLGEYQAGGYIVVLGLGGDGAPPVGRFCAAGMHGGKIFLRCTRPPRDLPGQVECSQAGRRDLEEIAPILKEFCACFDLDWKTLLEDTFYVLTPSTKNPYRQLYTYL